ATADRPALGSMANRQPAHETRRPTELGLESPGDFAPPLLEEPGATGRTNHERSRPLNLRRGRSGRRALPSGPQALAGDPERPSTRVPARAASRSLRRHAVAFRSVEGGHPDIHRSLAVSRGVSPLRSGETRSAAGPWRMSGWCSGGAVTSHGLRNGAPG